MMFGKVLRRNEEQAVASWINYLNQVRLDRLIEGLNNQEINFSDAINTLVSTMAKINETIIERNRGGLKGMHGFIAEVAECGVGNAREQILGKMPIYKWVNDNGPADLIRDGVEIQQKFVNSGNHLSLQAIKQHYSDYPWFLDGGRKYQIPADHYEKIKYLLSIPEEQANKMPKSNGKKFMNFLMVRKLNYLILNHQGSVIKMYREIKFRRPSVLKRIRLRKQMRRFVKIYTRKARLR